MYAKNYYNIGFQVKRHLGDIIIDPWRKKKTSFPTCQKGLFGHKDLKWNAVLFCN
jgi:hypothetical protein